jgi:predicted GTPase
VTANAPLRPRVAELCAEIASELGDDAARHAVEQIGRAVCEPLVVAVAGRLKAGKSTLVNALLGRRVAPVAIGECTRVVTWFRYGTVERIEVTPYHGESWTLPFDADGAIPRDLGAHHDDIQRVDVWISNALLEQLTIVDTPGLESATTDVGAAAADLLAIDPESRAAIAAADALVFLFPQLAASDRDRLRSFRKLFDGTALSPVNALGVLTKADKTAPIGEDPLPVAATLAAEYADILRDVVCTVLPVVGLLAETTEAGRFTETDLEDLRHLAQLDTATLEQLLLTVDWFCSLPVADVPPERRATLLQRLDLFGVRRALSTMEQGPRSTPAVIDGLREASGLASLRAVVHDHFAARADALKVYAALGELERISYEADRAGDVGRGHSVRTRIERLRLDPAMHQLAEFDAYHAWWNGVAELSSDFGAELRALVVETDPAARLGLPAGAAAAERAGRALELATRWLAFENDPRTSPAQVRIAAVAREAYVTLWEAAS